MKKKFPDGKSSNPAETNEQAYPVARVRRFLLSSFLEKEQGYVFVNETGACGIVSDPANPCSFE